MLVLCTFFSNSFYLPDIEGQPLLRNIHTYIYIYPYKYINMYLCNHVFVLKLTLANIIIYS